MSVWRVRLIIHRYHDAEFMAIDTARQQPDGTRMTPRSSMTIVTLHSGGKLRSLWNAYQQWRKERYDRHSQSK